MYYPELSLRVLGTLFLFLFSLALRAQELDSSNWTQTKDQWGQVLFCQHIYKMPEVQTRLYRFDIEQCNTAGQVIADLLTGHPDQDQLRMKAQAEQHAYRLAQHTSEPYHSVAACREYCRELVESRSR
jgi:hypothetical protein